MLDLNNVQKQKMLSALLLDWKAAQYQHRISYEIAELIGDPQVRLDNLRAEMERCQKAIRGLEERLLDLTKEIDT